MTHIDHLFLDDSVFNLVAWRLTGANYHGFPVIISLVIIDGNTIIDCGFSFGAPSDVASFSLC